MKKLVCLVLVLMFLPLFGCRRIEKLQQAIDDYEAAVADMNENFAEDKAEHLEEQARYAGIEMKKTVLLDCMGVTVTAKSMESSPNGNFEIKIEVKNKSDRKIGIDCDTVIVNNTIVDGLAACTVKKGKKAKSTIDVHTTELAAAGITKVGLVETYLYIYDAETYERLCEPTHAEIRTNLYDVMDAAQDVSGTEVYNKDGIRVLMQPGEVENVLGRAVPVFVENQSAKAVAVQCAEVAVNGAAINAVLSPIVFGGKREFTEMIFYANDLAQNGINAIERIDMKIRIVDPDTGETLDETDSVTVEYSR